MRLTVFKVQLTTPSGTPSGTSRGFSTQTVGKYAYDFQFENLFRVAKFLPSLFIKLLNF